MWISLNEFDARLTEVNVCYEVYNAADLCNSLLKDHKLGKDPIESDVLLSKMAKKLRENPTLFAVASAAAAQHIILAALKFYTFCKKHRTFTGLEYRSEDWKAVVKEAKTIVNIKARNDALAAVVAVDKAEQLYTSSQVPAKGEGATTHRMSKQSGQNDSDGQTETKNV